jgi:hypothetical protein
MKAVGSKDAGSKLGNVSSRDVLGSRPGKPFINIGETVVERIAFDVDEVPPVGCVGDFVPIALA